MFEITGIYDGEKLKRSIDNDPDAIYKYACAYPQRSRTRSTLSSIARAIQSVFAETPLRTGKYN